ncbi:MAG TPA: hypothetical protein VN376_08180, partial [Longilinea sp.]|nr:hypothetical protein [Longilinea sp.]
MKLFGKKDKQQETLPVNTIEFLDVSYPLAANLDEFFSIVSVHRACAIQFDIVDYVPFRQKLEALFKQKKFDPSFANAVGSELII